MNSRQYEKAAMAAREKGLPHPMSQTMEQLVADFVGDGSINAVINNHSVLVKREDGQESYLNYQDCWDFELDPGLAKGCFVLVDLDRQQVDACTFSNGDWVDIVTELKIGGEIALQKFSAKAAKKKPASSKLH